MQNYRWLLLVGLLSVAVSAIISCEGVKKEYSRHEVLAEIAMLEDQRWVDTTMTAAWVVDSDSLIRRKATYMIGIVGDSLYRPFLQTLLDDSCRSVLLQAVFAAGQMRDSASSARLMAYSESSDSTLQAYSIDALSKIGSRDAICRLVEIVADSLSPSWLRAFTAQCMHRLTDEDSKVALLDLGRIENNQIREKVYYALLRRADSTMQVLFKIGLQDTLEQIQIYSVIGERRLNDSTAIDRIAARLQKDNWRLKYHTLNTIGALSLVELVKAVSNLLDEREHVYVRQAAIRALGNLGSASVELRLRPLLSADDPNLAAEALVALSRIKGEAFLSEIDEFGQSANPRLRAAAVQSYGLIGSDSALIALVAMYGDDSPQVRVEVLDQVYSLEQDSLAVALTEMALNDSDLVPVVRACSYIGSTRAEGLIPQMSRLFDRDFGLATFEVRTSVLDALLEFGDSLAVSDEISAAVLSGRQDSHFTVRKRSRELAERLGLPSDIRSPHYATGVSIANYKDFFERYDKNPKAILQTSKGKITIELYYQSAPKTVINFIELAEAGYYDTLAWIRVVPDFVIQDGCPRGDGWGGPGYEIRCEYNDRHYEMGSVGMATSGKDTGGSQYFICQSPQPHLDGRYTLFGQVIDGMNVATLVEVGDTIYSVKIVE